MKTVNPFNHPYPFNAGDCSCPRCGKAARYCAVDCGDEREHAHYAVICWSCPRPSPAGKPRSDARGAEALTGSGHVESELVSALQGLTATQHEIMQQHYLWLRDHLG